MLALLTYLVEDARIAKQFCHELLALHHYVRPHATPEQRKEQWLEMDVFRPPLARSKAAFIRQVIQEVFAVGQHLPLALLEFVLDSAVPTIAAKGRRALMEDRQVKGGRTKGDERATNVGPQLLAHLVHRQRWSEDLAPRQFPAKRHLYIALERQHTYVDYLVSPHFLSIALGFQIWGPQPQYEMLEWAEWLTTTEYESKGVHAGDSISFTLFPDGHVIMGAITERENHKTGRRPGFQHRAAITSMKLVVHGMCVQCTDGTEEWIDGTVNNLSEIQGYLRDATHVHKVRYTPGAAAPGIYKAVCKLLLHHVRFL